MNGAEAASMWRWDMLPLATIPLDPRVLLDYKILRPALHMRSKKPIADKYWCSCSQVHTPVIHI